ncbi:BapA/Bap/LapF family prefix-like domain-containing protein [Acinetobacter lanii]|uniref:Biofilm-associated protein BapA-like prefix-like domain-containing protein n=1 Tax=Acinetobacter lanii TaxID=2715163 RepID=A0A6G8S515_9GAMM|nr:hypothetical protein [Acinetobacter lanii]QIO09257.1 hypothetical protein G8D99_09655 [Acinetobacter lanii]
MSNFLVIDKKSHVELNNIDDLEVINLPQNATLIKLENLDKKIKEIKVENNDVIIIFEDNQQIILKGFFNSDHSLVVENENQELLWVQFKDENGNILDQVKFLLLDDIEPLLYEQNEVSSDLLWGAAAIAGAGAVVAIASSDGHKSHETNIGQDGINGQDGLTPYIGANGNWFIGNKDTGIKAQGNEGEQGDSAYTIYRDQAEDKVLSDVGLTDSNKDAWLAQPENKDKTEADFKKAQDEAIAKAESEGKILDESAWLNDLKGDQGEAGQDGLTPYIGANGNWFIGKKDTGIQAQGEQGQSGYDIYRDQAEDKVLSDAGLSDTDKDTWLAQPENQDKTEDDFKQAQEDAIFKAESEGKILDESAWLNDLKGEQGDKGEAGKDGTDGKSAYELAVDNGYTSTLEDWLAALKGEAGANGQSAFEIAKENGYTGTEQEWLASLIGKDGADGADGKSAYELALENGYEGTIQEWLDGLTIEVIGAEGKSAYDLAVENGFAGTLSEWLASLKGDAGADGKDGYTPYVGSNGNWWINGIDTGFTSTGQNGVSPTIKDGVWYIGQESTNISVQAKVEIINGNWHVNGVDTGVQAQGAAGKDGISPTIKDGVWYIGQESTNIPVQAKVEIINGNWHVNGVDTGVQAQGVAGAAGKDGISPTIKDGVWYIGQESTNIPVQAKVEIINGNWHVNGVDTGVQAQGVAGAAGKDGISPTIKDGVWYIGQESTNISVQAKVEIINGNWHVNGVDTGVQAQGVAGAAGKDGISPTIKDGVWYIGQESTNIPVQAKVEIINGNWHVNGVDTGVQAQGVAGAAGKDGISPTIKDGVWYIGQESTNIPVQAKVEIINGNWHVNGVDTGVQAQGVAGVAGKDGISPTIKDGVWYIGDESTNIPVQAKVEIINGNWHVNGVDTGVQAQGVAGAAGKDGISPTIKDGVWYIGQESTNIPVQAKVEIINGNWHVNGVDTGVQAQGAAGKDGISPTIKDGVWYIGQESTNIPVQAKVEIINGNWHVNGVDTGVQAQGVAGAAGKDGISPTIKDGVWYIGQESTNIPVQAKVEIINGNWHVNGVDTGVQAQGAAVLQVRMASARQSKTVFGTSVKRAPTFRYKPKLKSSTATGM